MVTLPRLQGLDLASAIQQFDQGRQAGIQRRERNALAEFGQAAFQGDQNALNQLFQANPQAAFSLAQINEQRQARADQNALAERRVTFNQERALKQDELNREKFEFDKSTTLEGLNIQRQKLIVATNEAARKALPNPEDVQKLRKEFVTMSKDYIKVRDAHNRVQATNAGPDATGADDVALVFNFMKILDPGSVVREGEFATAENTGGVDDKLRNVYNKVLSGQRLTPEQRANFRTTAQRLFKAQDAQQQKLFTTFERLAEKQGIDPNDVAIDIGIVPSPNVPEQPDTVAPSDVPVGATATGPNGQRIQWNGQQWVPLQ